MPVLFQKSACPFLGWRLAVLALLVGGERFVGGKIGKKLPLGTTGNRQILLGRHFARRGCAGGNTQLGKLASGSKRSRPLPSVYLLVEVCLPWAPAPALPAPAPPARFGYEEMLPPIPVDSSRGVESGDSLVGGGPSGPRSKRNLPCQARPAATWKTLFWRGIHATLYDGTLARGAGGDAAATRRGE